MIFDLKDDNKLSTLDPTKRVILQGKPVFNPVLTESGWVHVEMTLQEKLDYLAENE